MRFSVRLAFLSLVSLSTTIWGCSPKNSDIVVLQVGPDVISLQEYEQFFQRNSGNWEAARLSSLEEREKFLDLLTKYHLKLRDAYSRKLDERPDVEAELHEYRANLATSYLLERELVDPSLKQMYDRRREELRASHILLRLAAGASPEESLQVWNRALGLIAELQHGAKFDSLAQAVSEDPSAKTNKGDLYYFSTGQMVGPFEEAAYVLKPDQITQLPVRSTFGYHIIKLTDRKPAVESIRVRHIMVSSKQSDTDNTGFDTARKMILEYRDSLRAGIDFADWAARHSDDPGSAPRGGDLGFFQRRRFVQDFEEIAFNLKPGQISDTVRTSFGYHLIKCEEIKPLRPFEEMHADLQKSFKQLRYNDEYRKYVNRYKNTFGYTLHKDVMDAFIPFVDSTKLPSDSGWADKTPTDLRREILLTVGSRSITVDSAIAVMNSRAEFKDTPLIPSHMPERIDRVGDFVTLELASAGLEDRYPDFKKLMKEFHDGVVLYKGEQLEVWNNIAIDEEKMRKFFGERREMFVFPNRIEVIEFSANSESLAVFIMKKLASGANPDTLLNREMKTATVIKTNRGLISAQTDSFTQQAWAHETGSSLGPILYNNRYLVLFVSKKDPARQKTYEEASAEVSTMFQDFEAKRLEQAWLDRLHRDYPVVQNKEALQKAFAGAPPSE